MEKTIEKHFPEIAQLIRKAKNNALKSVNIELINLYWQVGKYINAKVESAIWRAGVVKSLAAYFKGFNYYKHAFCVKLRFVMKKILLTFSKAMNKINFCKLIKATQLHNYIKNAIVRP